MKLKTRYVIFITIILMLSFIVALTNFSIASSKFEVSNVNVSLIGTKAEIKWDKTNGADGYEIYVELPAIGYLNLGNVNDNKVSIFGFEEGEIYGIKVKAYKNVNNGKVYSEFSPEVVFKVGEGTTSTKLGKVTNVKAVSLGSSGTVSWDITEIFLIN